MNSQKSAYENALNSLGNSHYAIQQEAREGDDRQAKIREVAKTVTSDFGNMMLSHVATTTLSKLGKMGNQLSKIGINSEDAKILTKAITNGDREELGKMIGRLGGTKVKLGIQKLTGKTLTDEQLPDAIEQQIDQNAVNSSRTLEQGIRARPIAQTREDMAGENYELRAYQPSTGAEESGQTPQRDPDFDNDEFPDYNERFNDNFTGRDPEGTDSDFFQQMRGEASRAQPDQDEYEDEGEKFEDAQEEPGPGAGEGAGAGEDVEDATKIGSTASKALSGGEDVAEGFEAATLASTAGDENPVGLLVTAGLGIASLFTGLFLKSKKPKIIQPPPVLANNYAVQAGLS